MAIQSSLRESSNWDHAMDLDSLSCNKCGANLDAPTGTNYLTCNHCGARLAVRRNESATYTELMEAVARPLDAMAGHLGELVQERALERIDREWEQEREQYYVTTRTGARQIPDATSSIVGGVVVTAFGVFWTIMAGSMAVTVGGGGPAGMVACFPLFGVLFVLFGIAMSVVSYQKAQGYQNAQRRYQRRREAALRGDVDLRRS